MIENIRKEFKIILAETDWMDDESRNLAIEKVKNLKKKIHVEAKLK
jgi:predicted metalloendopeptidase